MKAYLLYPDRDFDLGAELPVNADDLVQDLELNTLFGIMAGEDKFLFEAARMAVLTGMANPAETIRYRQDALRDCIANPGAIRELYEAVLTTITGRRSRDGLLYLGNYPTAILNRSVDLVDAQMEGLRTIRGLAEANRDRFRSRAFSTLFSILMAELDGEYMETIAHHLAQLKFREGILVSAHLGQGNKGRDYVLRNAREEKTGWLEKLSRFFGEKKEEYTFHLHPRDEAGARALSELRDRGINLAANAVAQSAEHILSFLTMMRAELAFYVGCLNLHDWLQGKGEPLAFPEPLPASERGHHFEGLYDVCLSLSMDKRVVGNDVDADGKVLTIVTGANSGGKSTFMRSFGLAQMMMQAGMFVPAVSFSANLCSAVYTHYKREEDNSMTSGKFDEELSRMSRLADLVTGSSLVLFNESFASTNDREGSEIARMIVDVLREKRIKMIFVTHLYAFAHAYVGVGDDIMFLRAEREEDGTRTFKLVEAEPLRTSYGQDLYKAVFQEGDRELQSA
jgi:DNA mismatch repair ATPase MutS